MNQQPYQMPPRWWSPQLKPAWVRFWRQLRKRRGFREQALCGVNVQNLDYVRDAISRNGGVLITPNHPSHADPFVMLEVADQLGSPFYFMTAWQVFDSTHALGRRVLRQHGCFSVNREGHDIRAVRQAIDVVRDGKVPLVMFPEGEVYHLNDRVTPFRRGAIQTAAWAAKRSGASVSVIPCGIKFVFLEDPVPALHNQMDRLEKAVGCPSGAQLVILSRVCRFADFMLRRMETEITGVAKSGQPGPRVAALIEHILHPLENRYGTTQPSVVLPERIKRLRQRIVTLLETPFADPRGDREQRDLEQIFIASQLYSYPTDYLAGEPSVERISETVEKFSEDLLGVRRVQPPARRRAEVCFADPLLVSSDDAQRPRVRALTDQLQGRVQSAIDAINRSAAASKTLPIELNSASYAA